MYSPSVQYVRILEIVTAPHKQLLWSLITIIRSGQSKSAVFRAVAAIIEICAERELQVAGHVPSHARLQNPRGVADIGNGGDKGIQQRMDFQAQFERSVIERLKSEQGKIGIIRRSGDASATDEMSAPFIIQRFIPGG